jgi:very-short-patch-repair endonuclease
MLNTTFAKTLRKEETPTEKRLWYYLRRKQLKEFKFRRQQPIGPYIVDFYCPAQKLVIEIDGGIHYTDDAQTPDKDRQDYLETQGLTVLRFTTDEIKYQINAVLDLVSLHLDRAIL